MTKLFIIANVSALFFASATDFLDGWSKLGAIGVLGALLVILLYKTIPDMSKQYRDARVEDSKMQTDAMDKLSKSIDRMGDKIESGNADQLELLKSCLMDKNK